MDIVACSVVCPGPIRLVADRQCLSYHRSKAFSAAQSRHEF
jgi:hypothetical protein